MENSSCGRYVALATVCAVLLGGCAHGTTGSLYSWNSVSAAHYLDRREARWRTWSGSARGDGTFCVSCHTALSYALVRPEIHVDYEDQNGAIEEKRLVENVRQRVHLWQGIGPYYPTKRDESRGTEAVLNALILATSDARSNGDMSAGTRAAFDDMWALQKTSGDQKGAWAWLQFNQEPWEAPDSAYYGACLAALAVGTAPDRYGDNPGIQAHLALLRDYLDRYYDTATPINHVTLLWASSQLPGLLSPRMQHSIVSEIYDSQRADGGWDLSTLIGNWTRTDGTPLVLKSDGYATGLVTYVLQLSGVPLSDPHLNRGLRWLSANQSWWNGSWTAYSPNKRRHDPFSNVSQFMNDAATAYAALALAQANTTMGSAPRHRFVLQSTSGIAEHSSDGQPGFDGKSLP